MIYDTIVIDGYSHPDFDESNPNASPEINLRGSSAPAGSSGLILVPGASNSIVRGLAISGFPASGILISPFFAPAPSGIRIEGNHLGVWRGVFYTSGNGEDGLEIVSSNNNRIGTTCAPIVGCTGRGNVISANARHGVHLSGTSQGNRIGGNFIGTERFGNATSVPFGGSTPNDEWGVFVGEDAIDNQIGGYAVWAPLGPVLATYTAGNTISGNLAGGVRLEGTFNDVLANHIGTNAAGTSALPNLGAGVAVVGDDNRVGYSSDSGNVISGNTGSGIALVTPSGFTPYRTVITGNSIGVDATGAAPLGNGAHGISVWGNQGSIRSNTIGGNTLAGISSHAYSGTIEQNWVGTNSSGRRPRQRDDRHRPEWRARRRRRRRTRQHRRLQPRRHLGGRLELLDHDPGQLRGHGPVRPRPRQHPPGHPAFRRGLPGRRPGRSHERPRERRGLERRRRHRRRRGERSGSRQLHRHERVGTTTWATTATASGPMLRSGCRVRSGAEATTPDADVSRMGNRIAYNAGAGIVVDGSEEIALRGNQLHSNGGLAIDLGDDGETVNDFADADGGANLLQNSPLIDPSNTQWIQATNDLQVRYMVSSAPGGVAYPLTVDFYVHDPWLEEGDEARVWVGSDQYTAGDALGFKTALVNPAPGAFVPNPYGFVFEGLRATATDANGNTSELSMQPVPVPEPGFAWSALAGIGLLAVFGRRSPPRAA